VTRLCATVPEHGHRRRLAEREDWHILDVFLQNLFASLVPKVQPPAPVCEDCGKPFEALTRKGRRVRKSVCNTCSQRRWKAKVGEERLRKMWVRQKQPVLNKE
jgi:hypothetical protein